MSLVDEFRRAADEDRRLAAEHQQSARLLDNLAHLCTADVAETLKWVIRRQDRLENELQEIRTHMSQLDTLIAQADANEQKQETVILGLRSDKATLQQELDASQSALTALQNAGGTPEEIAAMQAVVERQNAFLNASQAQTADPGSVQVVDTTGGTVTTTTATAGDTTTATADPGQDAATNVPAGVPNGDTTTQATNAG